MIRERALRWRRGLVVALPGLWVLGVVCWELLSPLGAQFVQLLAAAPAIACAGTGRRQCVVLGGACALFALVPLGSAGRAEAGRLGTCCAILAVVGAGYLTSGRGRRLAQELEHVREVAAAAQRALLRPLPPLLDGLALAGGHLSASRGALVGGDLYEALATPHGVRVVMGDVRGHGLPALGTVAALLGSFREAAHDEPELPGVLRRLERALQRHLRERARTDAGPGAASAGAVRERADAEEFVTVLLLEVSEEGEVTALNCGHPWPHRLTGTPHGTPRAVTVAPGDPLPPLGAFPLPAELPLLALDRLRPGDALVLHTDGAEDARDAAGAFFPLTGVLTEAARRTPPAPAAVVEHVQDALLRHTGGRLGDDIALLALRNDRTRVPARPAPAPLARCARR
ncbi:PP2C family protein-serine/threonine phosphatase [Streptomyces griseocarneus]|uniref:PP2C family protein-serine/threonine phosphatase n=1 Tax=Streptomyces griseocarneus TaxID=51201 RepID=UPI00167E94C7|nr:PP2C family protein-serine/threonine phosphatase [Streptomyces griseocarneus]MBZ6474527.1 serine/threonine-protein phosphatase [Streptomyces griseocarneus]